MKKKILYIILAIIIIGAAYFFYEMYGFTKGVQEDSKKTKIEIRL